MTGISLLVMRMSSKNPRVPNSATPWVTTPPADTTQPIPPIFEWKVDPLPTTPEDTILNALDETIEVDWNGLPLEQALAELLEPIPLDYRGYATDPSRASEFESTVQLRHRATRKQILQRVLGPRDLGYIVRPSGIEIGDLDYVRANPTVRRYSLAHVCKTNLEAAEIVQVLQRMLKPNDPDSISMTLNGPILLVRATEPEHEQIIQVLAALEPDVQP